VDAPPRDPRLVPWFIPVLGLVGGPLVLASAAGQMFGVFEQISVWAFGQRG
jgi:hypothetical protein